MTRWVPALSVFAVVTILLPGIDAPRAEARRTRPPARSLVLPIPPNQTWYVCQGYNGQITHAGMPALDLSLDRRSAGSEGCLAGSKYSSAGSVVTSPGDGTASRWPGCCGDDFVCVDLDLGGSVAVGHLSHRVRDGSRVTAGSRIGTVAWPDQSNGDFSHVHVQAHPAWGCTEAGDPVAFDVAHGFKWRCTPDLPYSGTVNQYSGLAVARCGSSGEGDHARRSAARSADRSACARGSSCLRGLGLRLVELLRRLVARAAGAEGAR